MADDPRVEQLLDELLDSNATPDGVCGDCPELLPQVRERWRQVRRAQTELDAMFPPMSELGNTIPSAAVADTALPAIPGYRVEAVLGLGGMGVVFRARHLSLNRDVALKMAVAGAYAGPHERERFQREAEAIAGLRHPNIVQIYDVGDSAGRPYFTMEFVDGGSLSQKLAGTPLPPREAAALAATLAGAVHAAHQGGIVHRDLKPANVLLTADGTPKVSDFGLARRVDGEAGLTMTGTAIGTPSYMAPEQARGKADAVGPAADIYALGAILYELLTGRPPFRAESAAETVHQLLSQDPAAPSRLNARVPRALETICLKCLHKEPRLRYATAAELAEDLGRFLRGEAIAARPEGGLARLVRRVRRRPFLSAAIFCGTLAAIAFSAGGLWLRAERAAAEQAVADDLEKMAEFLKRSSWVEARTALERAKGRLGDGGSEIQRHRLEDGERDLALAARLDAIRLNRSATVQGYFNKQYNQGKADQEYEAAFRAAGLGEPKTGSQDTVKLLRASNIKAALVAALDDWAVCVQSDEGRRRWLLMLASGADPDPSGWRDRVRDPATWGDAKALLSLAREPRARDQSVELLVGLGERLHDAGQSPTEFLRQVQQAHPADFWANTALGDEVRETDVVEAARSYQAALAIRPTAATAYTNLGAALGSIGQMDEATVYLRRAVELDPTMSLAYANLGRALAAKGQYDAAIEQHRRAVGLTPTWAYAHVYLGGCLLEAGRPDEALVELREAARVEPDSADAHNGLGYAMLAMGKPDAALTHLRRAIEIDPKFADAHNNLGRVWMAQHKLDAAAERFLRAIELRPNRALPYHNLGLVRFMQGRQDEAVKRIEEAIRIDPRLAGPHASLGIILRSNHRLDDAVEQLHQAIQLNPKMTQAHKALSDVLLRQGKFREAQAAAKRSLELLPKDDPGVFAATQELKRRDEMVALDDSFPSVLNGQPRPADAAACIRFAQFCRIKEHYAAAAKFADDAFARHPSWMTEPYAGQRYFSACVAALAGCGRGKDAGALADTGRQRLRGQARQWLRADLAAYRKALAGNSAKDRDLVRVSLRNWQTDPDLAGLRDPAELNDLPADEQKDTLALWAEVKVVLNRCEDGGKD
jgi:tetratricopeptide (TPR) repeat protein